MRPATSILLWCRRAPRAYQVTYSRLAGLVCRLQLAVPGVAFVSGELCSDSWRKALSSVSNTQSVTGTIGKER